MIEIINKCRVCHLGLQDQNGIYVVPLNFGYEYKDNKLVLYFHSAKEGKKLDIILHNNLIGFEMDCEHYLIEAKEACGYSYSFKSIIGNGRAYIVTNLEEKKKALQVLMKHQSGKDFLFTEEMVSNIVVIKVEVIEFSGKDHKR